MWQGRGDYLDNRFHRDRYNAAISRAADRIQHLERMQEDISVCEEAQQFMIQAFTLLGKGLHPLQDMFAHTKYFVRKIPKLKKKDLLYRSM